MAKRADEGHRETEELLKRLEHEITEEYALATKEIKEKLDDYLARFATKDKIRSEAVKSGKLTEEDYKQWRIGQMAMGARWDNLRKELAEDLSNATGIAKSITQGYLPEVYATNFNFGTYQIEKAGLVDTSFILYDRNTVQRLFDNSATFYHSAGKRLMADINSGKVQEWNKRQIQSVLIQGILQGESIPHIATRLSVATSDSNRKASIRNARTMVTGVQNAGRVDAYTRAEKMGVETMQEWLATLDERTRYEHRQLDGMRVKVGESFHIDGYTIAYPGDPYGAAEMVYNCRCTLVPVVVGFEISADDTELRHDSHLGDMSYKEWKESHYSYSDTITKQDEIAEKMRESYIRDYRYLSGENPSGPVEPETPFEGGTTNITPEESAEPENFSQNHADFTPAATIGEAEEYAKQFISGDFSYTVTGKQTSFKGVSLDNANAINQRLTDIFAQFNIDKLTSIEAFGKQQKKLYAQHKDAPMMMSNFGNLLLNNSIVKNADTIKDYIREGNEAREYAIKNINLLSGSAREIVERYKEAGRDLVGTDIQDFVTHEMGHLISKMSGVKDGLSEADGWEEYAYKLSGYAGHSFGECIAESFAAYYNGERENIHPKIIEEFDKLRKNK